MKTVKLPGATKEQTDGLRAVMHVPGPIEILCKEIGFRYRVGMETPAMLRAFVCQLVADIDQMRYFSRFMVRHGGKPPSAEADETFNRIHLMLGQTEPEGMVRMAAEAHDYIRTVHSDEGPCDHLIDMLSSCASAIRFAFEAPCHSRHAASAAKHIWRLRYGVTLEDSLTGAWSNDYAKDVLERAMLLQIASINPLNDALRRLAFQARTSGGTAGRDGDLCAACDHAEAILNSH